MDTVHCNVGKDKGKDKAKESSKDSKDKSNSKDGESGLIAQAFQGVGCLFVLHSGIPDFQSGHVGSSPTVCSKIVV